MALQITEITNEPKQQHIFTVEDVEEKITFYLEFKPNQNAWFFNLDWGDFSVNNVQIVKSYNILRQFKNIIPFGIGIYTKSGQDPMVDTAFSDGDAQLFLLTADEVEEIETELYG